MREWHSLEWVWPRLLIPMVWLGLIVWRTARQRWSQKTRPTQQVKLSAVPWYQTTSHRVSKWQKWGLAALLFAGCALMLLSIARPKAVLLMPSRLDGVMLAIDSSGSMRATDIKPSRIEVAQQIATRLIDTLPSQVKMGVVSTAGTASLIQAPTEERDDLRKAVDGLSLQPSSAVGSGLVIALDALLPASGIDLKKILDDAPPTPNNPASSPIASASPKVQKLEPGANKSQALVLITDGQGNMGADPIKMAQIAADLGVRVYTIGVGTTQGTVLKARGMQARVKLDEEVLKRIADMTGGQYFRADSDLTLDRIYQQLSMKIALKKHRQTEVTALFALVGIGLLLLGAMLRFRQTGRVI